MHEAVAAIAATGISPVVRIAANESWMVKRMYPLAGFPFQPSQFSPMMVWILIPRIGALDAGAHGIVVPLLYTVDDARKLVESAKFPPLGKRGFGSPFSMASFGTLTQTDYLFQANDALVTIVQIETKEAFENVRFAEIYQRLIIL